MYALHHIYSEGVGAVKIVYYNLVFNINKLNFTINERSVRRNPFIISGYSL